jgi:rhamnosyltransferase
MKICSIITIYKPNIIKLKENIENMLQYSNVVYLLFNSPIIDYLQFDERIICIDNKKNIGLSKAINIGVSQAASDGYSYAILFDQDSSLTKENFILLFNEFIEEEKYQKIMCIGPSLDVRNNKIVTPNWVKTNLKVKSENVYSVYHIITSGMLVNINNFLMVNGFNEEYPVDGCDSSFCWKSLSKGYVVLQSKDAYIFHEVGTHAIKIFNHAIHFHAPYRNYFFIRETLNICFVLKETPFIVRCHKLLYFPFRMLLYILALDKKPLRLKMYVLGFRDFFCKRHGFASISKILNAED